MPPAPTDSDTVSGEAVAPIPEGIKPRTESAEEAPPPARVGRPPWTRAWPRAWARAWGRAPILPNASAEGAPLVAVIAVISALAALALAAFVAIAAATESWTNDLSTSMTVQVKGADAATIALKAAKAKAVLDRTAGVVSAETSTPEEAARLLEPWLGDGAEGYLNIPALIEITVDSAAPPDLKKLEADLDAAAEGLSLDDHRTWNAALASTAGAAQTLALAVFLLITGAACAVAVFAARAGLAANAEIVALLHLIGATDHFIAGEVQRRFFVIGLSGALIGVAAALGAALLAAAALGSGPSGAAFDAYFAPVYGLSPLMIAPLAIVPAAICLATALTARFTVLSALSKEL